MELLEGKEPPAIFYTKEEYIETLTGNRVSRKSVLCGSQNIRLLGKAIIKPSTIIRGDLANINIGRYSLLGENTVIRPSYKRFKGGIAFFPLNIGDHVMIEDDCVITATSIGSYVHIGKGSVISRRCILKECCVILEGSVLPPDTVVPPFTVFGGVPARYQYELPESFQEVQKQRSVGYYDSMVLKTDQ
eukprot:TRINITY_DN2599_c0_g1_i1.p1 TRINITY_DN2599_c0_g1~~TRINITY_DN2599_c0_g1_i1.p1  ORF type:complete len:189 (-),score=28.95 TRINITY_DN2599_c0_g1_i1:12-578(-)